MTTKPLTMDPLTKRGEKLIRQGRGGAQFAFQPVSGARGRFKVTLLKSPNPFPEQVATALLAFGPTRWPSVDQISELIGLRVKRVPIKGAAGSALYDATKSELHRLGIGTLDPNEVTARAMQVGRRAAFTRERAALLAQDIEDGKRAGDDLSNAELRTLLDLLSEEFQAVFVVTYTRETRRGAQGDLSFDSEVSTSGETYTFSGFEGRARAVACYERLQGERRGLLIAAAEDKAAWTITRCATVELTRNGAMIMGEG